MKLYAVLSIVALLIVHSSSISSSETHLRSSSNHDDDPESGGDERGLGGICTGTVKTYYYLADIAMLSPYSLNCNSNEVKQIGTVIENSFDDVVNLDKSLAPLTLNTTICTGSVNQTVFRRRLVTTVYKFSGGKYKKQFLSDYMVKGCSSSFPLTGGKCNLCSSDNKDRTLQSLLPSISYPTSPSSSGTSSVNSAISYAQLMAIKGILISFSPNSTLFDYKTLLQYLLNMYLTNQVTNCFWVNTW